MTLDVLHFNCNSMEMCVCLLGHCSEFNSIWNWPIIDSELINALEVTSVPLIGFCFIFVVVSFSDCVTIQVISEITALHLFSIEIIERKNVLNKKLWKFCIFSKNEDFLFKRNIFQSNGFFWAHKAKKTGKYFFITFDAMRWNAINLPRYARCYTCATFLYVNCEIGLFLLLFVPIPM